MQSAQRPMVVLLHSSASSSRQWDALLDALTPIYCVHAIDFHDHGKQRAWKHESPLTLADEAALVSPLLEEAGGAHVIGHSYGGAVALKLATMHPEQVRSVAVYEPVLFRWLIDDVDHDGSVQDIIAVAESMRDLLSIGQEFAAARRFVDFWSGEGSWESLSTKGQSAVAARAHAVLRHFDALFREPMRRSQVASLRVPMLFLSGAQTVAVEREVAQVLRRTVPHARHEVLPSMGHMGPMTHAAEVNWRLVRSLDEQFEVELRAAA